MSDDQNNMDAQTQGVKSRTTTLLEGESQAAIVKRMFMRRRTAVWGLRGAGVLVLVAIYAPVLCSGLPLAWKEPGGGIEFPWLRRLFDQNYWTNSIDRIYNLLMVVLTIYFVVGLVLRFAVKVVERRQEIRQVLRKWFALGALLLIILQQLGLPFLATSEAYTDYRGDLRSYMPATWDAKAREASSKAAEADAEASRLRSAAGDPSKNDVARREAERLQPRVLELVLKANNAQKRAAYLRTHPATAIFLPIPYGHREQLGGAEDGYRGLLSFSGGERHLLGTDKVGRDLFARLVYGTRISLSVGLLAVAIYVTIGTIMGAIAGYAGGRVDMFIMRAIEIIICVPGLFLILTIVALFDVKSIFMIMVAIGIVGWTGIARLVRGEILRERAKDYVSAAKSLGLSSRRILFRHILPNAISPVIVAATFGVAGAIITESTLSFLGLGDSNVPSWGMILDAGRTDHEWHMILCPGVAIFVTVTLLNMVGDGLRDALDPKLRN